MLTKLYFNFIGALQETLLWVSVGMLLILPIALAFFPDYLPEGFYTFLFDLSLLAVFLVMSIRPLADLFPNIPCLRPLVILRKGYGVFSASIIVSIMLSRVMLDGVGYLAGFFNPAHWSLTGGALFAPLGDLSALILLVTSNKFSKRVLKKSWKLIQKLSYVYFYSGVFYEFIALGKLLPLVAAFFVTWVTLAAYIGNRIPMLSPKRI